jgi:branched-subunit amino acid transport protein
MVWLLFLVIGAGTFLLRFSVIALWGRLGTVPDGVERGLRFIPPAVLSALVLPAVATSNGHFEVGPRTVASLVAVLVAWKTRSVFFTIVAGMAALWVIQALQ